jgi:hypothetical protein
MIALPEDVHVVFPVPDGVSDMLSYSLNVELETKTTNRDV